ncbi:Prolyl 4-hydroxylase subunit alpha-3, partial [Dissostichus eleginoides]
MVPIRKQTEDLLNKEIWAQFLLSVSLVSLDQRLSKMWGLPLTPPPCGLRGCLQTVAGAPGGLSGTTCGNLIVALGQRR